MDKKREETKKEKITKGTVTVNKQNSLSKAMGSFFVRDIHEAGEYFTQTLLVPKLRGFVDEILTGAIHAMLGGGRNDSRSGAKTNYNRQYISSSDRDEFRRYDYDRADYSYRDFTFESRADAERVLDILYDDLREFKIVSVADLYDRAGLVCNNRQARKYGWIDLRNAEIISVRDGWAIKMPPVMPLD